MGQGAKSKANTVNPKDLVGSTKVSLTKVPPVAVIQAAMALMDGAEKYTPYSWRKDKILASIYIDAALRHLYCWFEGQENATDSQVHHLGHAIGCCAILLDAMTTGNLVDDRPVQGDGNWLETELTKQSEVIKRKKAAKRK